MTSKERRFNKRARECKTQSDVEKLNKAAKKQGVQLISPFKRLYWKSDIPCLYYHSCKRKICPYKHIFSQPKKKSLITNKRVKKPLCKNCGDKDDLHHLPAGQSLNRLSECPAFGYYCKICREYDHYEKQCGNFMEGYFNPAFMPRKTPKEQPMANELDNPNKNLFTILV